MYEQGTKPLKYLDEMTNLSQEIRVNYALAISADTITDALPYFDSIQSDKRQFEESSKQYEASLFDDAGRKYLSELEGALNDYVGEMPRVESMICDHQEGPDHETLERDHGPH